MDLTQIRDRIDQLDRQIAALLTERMDITNEVAAYKIEHNLPVYHPEREKQVRERLGEVEKLLNEAGIEACMTENIEKDALQKFSFVSPMERYDCHSHFKCLWHRRKNTAKVGLHGDRRLCLYFFND